MIKITKVVEEILESSEEALLALKSGYLNYHGFARSIRSEVERRAKKPVQVGSIVVALSRLRSQIARQPSLVPNISINHLAVRSGLAEASFNRTAENLATLRQLYQQDALHATDYLNVSHGTGEITIVTVDALLDNMVRLFYARSPKRSFGDWPALPFNLAKVILRRPMLFIRSCAAWL
jgi:hypothetical protein